MSENLDAEELQLPSERLGRLETCLMTTQHKEQTTWRLGAATIRGGEALLPRTWHQIR
jgi:hypothetical protein